MIQQIKFFWRRMFAAPPQPEQAQPQTVSQAFLEAALEHAEVVFLPNDSVFYGEIPGVRGVHATADTAAGCRAELRSALQDWADFRLARGLDLPDLRAIAPTEPVSV